MGLDLRKGTLIAAVLALIVVAVWAALTGGGRLTGFVAAGGTTSSYAVSPNATVDASNPLVIALPNPVRVRSVIVTGSGVLASGTVSVIVSGKSYALSSKPLGSLSGFVTAVTGTKNETPLDPNRVVRRGPRNGTVSPKTTTQLAYGNGPYDVDNNGIVGPQDAVDFRVNGTHACVIWTVVSQTASLFCRGNASCCTELGFPHQNGSSSYLVLTRAMAGGTDGTVLARASNESFSDPLTFSFGGTPERYVSLDQQCGSACSIDRVAGSVRIVVSSGTFNVTNVTVVYEALGGSVSNETRVEYAVNESGGSGRVLGPARALEHASERAPGANGAVVPGGARPSQRVANVQSSLVSALDRGRRERVVFRNASGVHARVVDKAEFDSLVRNGSVDSASIDAPVSVLSTDALGITGISAVQNATGLSGAGETVCVVDTGVNVQILRDAGVAYSTYNVLNGSLNVADGNGHGTEVTDALLQAAPGAKYVIVKAIADNGTGYESDVIHGLQTCAAHGADVVSLSVGSGLYNGTCDQNVLAQEANLLVSNGTIVIAAAGNEAGPILKSPACASNVTAVISTDANDTLAPSSSYLAGQAVLAAPGVDIRTLDRYANPTIASGTSMSAPFVSGAAAILLENDSNLTPLGLRSLLVDTGAFHNTSGFAYSRLDLENALQRNYTNNLSGTRAGVAANTSNGTANQTVATLSTISSCQTLSSAGTYTLSTDVTASGTCFTISASNVKLDCANHLINYSQSATGVGVLINNGLSGVTVANCRIEQGSTSTNSYALQAATSSPAVTNLLVENVTLVSYGDSSRTLYFDNVSHATVKNATSSAAGATFSQAFMLYDADNVLAEDMWLTSANNNVIQVYDPSQNVTLKNFNATSANTYPYAIVEVDGQNVTIIGANATYTGSTAGASVGVYATRAAQNTVIWNSTLVGYSYGMYAGHGNVTVYNTFSNGTNANNWIRDYNNPTDVVKFVNVTPYSGSVSWFSGTTSNFYYGWWADLFVNDTIYGPFAGVQVNYTDSGAYTSINPSGTGSVTTGTDGYYRKLPVYQYTANRTLTRQFTNYTFNATKSGYSNYSVRIVNMTSNRQINFTMQVGTPVSSCQTISSGGLYVLTSDISSTSTCINIGASNVFLSCAGHTITYDTGANGYRYGVEISSGVNNVTVQDCTLVNTNNASNSYGVYAAGTGTGSGRVTNLTIQGITGTQYSDLGAVIGMTNTTDATIKNSALNVWGSGGFETGIIAVHPINVTVTNVSVNSTGTNTRSIDWEEAVNWTLENSSITMHPTAHQHQGLNIVNSDGSVVRNFQATSDAQSEGMIVLNDANDTMFINVTTSGTGAAVMNWYSSKNVNNYFYNSTLSATGSGYYSAILFTNTALASNITLINSTYSSAEYDGSSGSTDYQLYSGWYTDLYVNDTLGGPISSAKVNYTDNGLRSSKNPSASGQVTVGADGRYHDLVLYQYVENYTGRYSFNNYTFNATKSGYSNSSVIASNISADKQINITMSVATATNACQTFSSSGYYKLTQNVSSAGTCFTVAANNTILDCAGYTINYSQTTGGLGVSISAGLVNTTIENCNIIQGPGGANSSDPIDIVGYTGTRISNVTISNVNLTTSIDTGGEGIWAQHVDNLAVTDARILHSGSTSYNWESVYYVDVQGGSITNSYINATRYGPRFDNVSNFVVRNTTFFETTGIGRGGPRFYTAIQNFTISNSTMTSADAAISFYAPSSALSIINSSITSAGSSSTVNLLGAATGSNVYLINTTQSGGSGPSVLNGSLHIGWYADLYVNDTYGNALSGIGVSYADAGSFPTNPTASGSVTTGSNGHSRDLVLYEKTVTNSGNTTYNNYTLTANDVTFRSAVVKSVNMTTDRLVVFTAALNGVFVTSPSLNATSIHNTTLDNLTVHYSMASATSNNTDWRLNGTSYAMLNMPFDTDVSSTSIGAVKDTTTFGMNGTLGGGTSSYAPTWTSSGYNGGAYTFNGVHDYIKIDDPNGLFNSTTTALTACAAFYLNPVSTPNGFWAVMGPGDNSWIMDTHNNSGTLYLHFYLYGGSSAQATINTGQWYYACGWFNGTNNAIYLNGNLVNTQSYAGGTMPNTADPMVIGYDGAGGEAWNGSIDDVLIFNRTLSAQQIKALYNDVSSKGSWNTLVSQETSIGNNWSVSITAYNSTDSSSATLTNPLIVTSPYQVQNQTLTSSPNDFTTNDNITASFDVTKYGPSSVTNETDWRLENVSIDTLNAPLDENVSSTASGAIHDLSTYGNNGTLGGGTSADAPTWTSSCIAGGCYTFDGTTDYIDFGNPADGSLDPGSGNFTFGLWVYPISNVGAYDMPLYKGGASASDAGYSMEFGTGAWGGTISDGTTTVGSYYSPINGATGAWYFVVEVVNRKTNTLRMYINGTQVDNDSIASVGAVNTAKPLVLGRHAANTDAFHGMIDQPFITKRALTADQIKSMYAEGLAGHAYTKIVSNMTSVGENWSARITTYADGIRQDSATTSQQQVHTPSTCGTVSSNTTLYNNVTGSGTCLEIYANDVTLDCAGHTVTFNTAGGTNTKGIYVSSDFNNTVIRNCVVVEGNSSAQSDDGIMYYGSGAIGHNLTISNVNVTMTGNRSSPIEIVQVDRAVIEHTHHTLTTPYQGWGLMLETTDHVNVTDYHVNRTNGIYPMFYLPSGNNTILRDATLSRSGSPGGADAIVAYAPSHNFTIDNVTITDTDAGDGGLDVETPATVNDLHITMTGNSARGIYALAGGSNLTNSNIWVNGTSAWGAALQNSTTPVRIDNLTAYSKSAYALETYLNNNTIITNSNLSATTGTVVRTEASDNITLINSVISTTGGTDLGVLTGTGPNGLKLINTTYDKTNVYVDTTPQSIIHDGWWVDLYTNDTSGNPVPGASINYADNGVYSSTNPTSPGPQYTDGNGYKRRVAFYQYFLNSTGTYYHTNYTFSASATGYQPLSGQSENVTTNRQITLTLTPPSCGTLTSDYTLHGDVSSTSTCFTIASSNVALDCAGHTITYSTGGSGKGVWIDPADNVTVKNCRIVQGGAAIGSQYRNAIYVGGTSATNATNILLQNDTLTTYDNSSGALSVRYAPGIAVSSVTANTDGNASNAIDLFHSGSASVTGSTAAVNGTSSYGVYLYASPGTTVTGTGATANGASSMAYYVSGTNNVQVSGGSATATGTSAYGILTSGSSDLNLTGMTISTTGPSGRGASIESSSSNVTIDTSTVSASNTGTRGIEYTNSNGGAITNSNVSTLGGSYAFGITLYYANTANLSNVFVSTNGSTSDALNIQYSNDTYLGDSTFETNATSAPGVRYSNSYRASIHRISATTRGSSSHAFDTGGLYDSIVEHSNFTAAGTSDWAFSSVNVANVNFTHVTFNGSGTSAPGIVWQTGSANQHYFNSTITAVGTDLDVGANSNADTFYFINTTYTPASTYWETTTAGTVLQGWYIDTYARDSGGSPLSGVSFSYSDNGLHSSADPTSTGVGTTDASGYDKDRVLYAKLQNQSGSYSFNDYSFAGSKTGYYPIVGQVETLNTNRQVTLMFSQSSCQNLSSSYTLVSNVNSPGTCFNITASNVVLDCAGHTINYSQSSAGYGVTLVPGLSNITIANCSIINGGGYTSGYGLFGNGTSSVNTTHVKIRNVDVSSYRIGIRGDNADFWSLRNVTIDATGENGIYGPNSNHWNITDTSVTANGSYSYGVYGGSNWNLTHVNITTSGSHAYGLVGSWTWVLSHVNVSTSGVASYGIYYQGSEWQVNDSAIHAADASDIYMNAASNSYYLNLINVSYGRSNVSFATSTAGTLHSGWHGIVYTNDTTGSPVSATVTYADNGAYSSKNPSSSGSIGTAPSGYHTGLTLYEYTQDGSGTYYHTNYTFDATKTGYQPSSVSENITGNTQVNLTLAATSCGNLTSSYTLSSDVSSSGTCFTIDTSNVVLDCAGHTINYSQSAEGYGVLVWDKTPWYTNTGISNVTIKNCRIVQGSTGGSSSSERPAILGWGWSNTPTGSLIGSAAVTRATNVTLLNDTIETYGPYASGIYADYASWWNASHVNITTHGAASYGFYYEEGSGKWWRFEDSSINAVSANDLQLSTGWSSNEVYLINTTYNPSSVSDDGTIINKGWWVDSTVTDTSLSPIDNALVLFDGNATKYPGVVGWHSNSSGQVRATIYEYTKNSTMYRGYNNYSISATRKGYLANTTVKNVTSDMSLSFELPLGPNSVCVKETGVCWPTIQQAVDNATSGQTVVITQNQTYYEGVVVNKSITITSNATSPPSIFADSTGFAIHHSNVVLDCNGSTINYSRASEGYGVLLWNTTMFVGLSNVTIENCNIVQATSDGSSSDYRVGILGWGAQDVPSGSLVSMLASTGANDVTVRNVNVTTRGDYAHAVYGEFASSWNVTDLTVLTSGLSADGLDLESGNGWNLSRTHVNVTGGGSNALFDALSTPATRLEDSSLHASQSTGDDLYYQTSADLYFVNTTYDPANSYFSSSYTSLLHVGWRTDLYVKDTASNPLIANVTYSDNGLNSAKNPASSGSVTTASDGYYHDLVLYQYAKNHVATYPHTNYTFNASKYGYSNYSIVLANVTGNTQYNFTLKLDTCTPPGSGNWVVNLSDNCTVTSTVNIYPNSLVLEGKGGTFTIENAGTLKAKHVDYTPSAFDGSSTFIVKTGGKLDVTK